MLGFVQFQAFIETLTTESLTIPQARNSLSECKVDMLKWDIKGEYH